MVPTKVQGYWKALRIRAEDPTSAELLDPDGGTQQMHSWCQNLGWGSLVC